jgi:hypothetical protein
MYRLGSILVISVLLFAPSCGRTKLDPVDGGEGGKGAGAAIAGTGGASATGGTGGTGGPTTCNWPSCMSSAGTDCLPAGDCIQQGSYSTGSANICYANGVKEIIGLDLSFNASVTMKNASKTCFTMNGSVLPLITGGGVVTLSLEDRAGNTIGSVVEDLTSNQLTVTCTGSKPVVLDPSCITGLSPSNACTSGTCVP